MTVEELAAAIPPQYRLSVRTLNRLIAGGERPPNDWEIPIFASHLGVPEWFLRQGLPDESPAAESDLAATLDALARGIEELRELVELSAGRAGSSDQRAGPPVSAAGYREAVITPLREGKGDPDSLRRLAAGRRQLAEELCIVADLEEEIADQLAADASP